MSEENKDVVKSESRAASERFLENVEKQLVAETGNEIALTEHESTLAQHLFLKVDAILRDFETKRQNGKKSNEITPYNWHNINMRKVALDAVHVVKLGLDALIPNHLHPVPYFDWRAKKYNLDLRIGYVGKEYYRLQMAVEKPVDIIKELVYSNDHFKPIKKDAGHAVETYEFDIKNPFDRGHIIGGFGYLVYEEETKNKLILVSEADFEKSKKAAQSDKFWNAHPERMRYKTLVHRITEMVPVDPMKINASFAHVEEMESDNSVRREVNENANSEVLDIKAEEPNEPEEKPEIIDLEPAEEQSDAVEPEEKPESTVIDQEPEQPKEKPVEWEPTIGGAYAEAREEKQKEEPIDITEEDFKAITEDDLPF
jgi:recombination protein RecT